MILLPVNDLKKTLGTSTLQLSLSFPGRLQAFAASPRTAASSAVKHVADFVSLKLIQAVCNEHIQLDAKEQ